MNAERIAGWRITKFIFLVFTVFPAVKLTKNSTYRQNVIMLRTSGKRMHERRKPQRKHTDTSFCLSQSVVFYRLSSKSKRNFWHIRYASTQRVKAGQLGHDDLIRARCHHYGHGWLVPMYWLRLAQKNHLTLRLTYRSTTIMLIFALCFSTFSKCLLGWKPTIPEQIPLSLFQTLTLTHEGVCQYIYQTFRPCFRCTVLLCNCFVCSLST